MPASLNQSDGQSERPPQTCFLTLHFPVIAFVIVPSEMKESVQGKNSDFFGYRMPQSTCVIRSNLRRNRHISSEPLRQPKRCGKRQHIRWFILTAETMIQSLQLPATSDQHIDGPSNSGRPLRAGYKLRQRRLIQPHDSLLNDNQAFSRRHPIQINRRAITAALPSNRARFILSLLLAQAPQYSAATSHCPPRWFCRSRRSWARVRIVAVRQAWFCARHKPG